MPEHTELELEQLWYVPTVRLRARAATEGFYKDGELLLRRVDLFLRYELPERVTASEFNPNIAPISLSFVYIGKEKEPLLIRKIYTGVDADGHSGAFFTHLIAGLPREFTARDAIRLWFCPRLWAESDSGKHPQDIYLGKIRYSDIRSYVEHSETQFNVAPVSEQLQNLLLLVLTKGLPQRILIRGHSVMIAPLIYGLTHALPIKLLPGLTFTTYVSKLEDSAAIITGTINGAELQDISRIQVQMEQISGPVPEDVQRYVDTAVNALVTGETEKLFNMIDEIEREDQVTVEDLINLFNRRFRTGPLTSKVLEDIFSHPARNRNEFIDPRFQEEAAQLLLSQPNYWNDRGRRGLQQVVDWLRPGVQSPLDQQTREALAKCINRMVEYILEVMRTELSQKNNPGQAIAVLDVLADPPLNSDVYLRLLIGLAHGSIYRHIISDQSWEFHRWLLSRAKMIQPQPTMEQIQPWLNIFTWDKLEEILKLDLPDDWEHRAIYSLLIATRDIPRKVLAVVKAYEEKFTRSMQSLLTYGSQTANQDWINATLRLFAAIIREDEQEHSLNRVGLLLKLLNAVPNDAQVIEALLAIVPFASPYQLAMDEFDRVVAGCRAEVLSAGGASPSLMKYLLEYIFMLSPKKLNANTINLLVQFQRASAALPESTAKLINSWLDIKTFLSSKAFDEEKLQTIRLALGSLAPPLKKRGQDIKGIFVEELAPHLATLIENEYQLAEVLDIFEEVQEGSSWDMLNALAARRGSIYVENMELSRLFTFVIVGIREYIRLAKPKEELDAYLQALFVGVSENVLGDIDKAIFARVWPEPIQSAWKGWRGKYSLVEKIRSGLFFPQPKPQPQSERAQPGSQSQPSILLRRQEQQATRLPDRASQVRQPAEQQPRRTLETQKLPAQQFTGPQPSRSETTQQSTPATPFRGFDAPQTTKRTDDQAQRSSLGRLPTAKKPSKTTDPVKLTIAIDNDTRIFTESQYQRLCQTFILILPYWGNVLKKEWDTSPLKSLKYEMRAIRNLHSELQVPSEKEKPAPETFVQFLVDDLIIKQEIIRIRETSEQKADDILNINNVVATHLSKLQGFIESGIYENFRASYGDGAIKNALYSLIYRYHLLRYLEEHEKGGFDYWIKVQRKQAKTQ